MASPHVNIYSAQRDAIMDGRLDVSDPPPEPPVATLSPADVKSAEEFGFDKTDVTVLFKKKN